MTQWVSTLKSLCRARRYANWSMAHCVIAVCVGYFWWAIKKGLWELSIYLLTENWNRYCLFACIATCPALIDNSTNLWCSECFMIHIYIILSGWEIIMQSSLTFRVTSHPDFPEFVPALFLVSRLINNDRLWEKLYITILSHLSYWMCYFLK